jgi:hypothetical protein
MHPCRAGMEPHYAGLVHPSIIAATCLVVGMIFVKETNHIDIHTGESLADQHRLAASQQVAPDEF